MVSRYSEPPPPPPDTMLWLGWDLPTLYRGGGGQVIILIAKRCIFLGVPEKGVNVEKEGRKCFLYPSFIAKLKTVGVVITATVNL